MHVSWKFRYSTNPNRSASEANRLRDEVSALTCQLEQARRTITAMERDQDLYG